MRTESVELTVLCLIHKNGRYLLQDRIKNDWKGYTLPGGHIEPGESIVDAVIKVVVKREKIFQPWASNTDMDQDFIRYLVMT